MEAGLLRRSDPVLPKLPGQAPGILGGEGEEQEQQPGDGRPGVGSHSLPPVVPIDASTSLLARGGRKGRGLARLQLLEAYSRALLEAEQVSRGPVLTAFFEPQIQDLEPSLPLGRCLTRPNSPREAFGWWGPSGGKRA